MKKDINNMVIGSFFVVPLGVEPNSPDYESSASTT